MIFRHEGSCKNQEFSPKIDFFGHLGPDLAGSFGGLVSGCGARAVSRKTPIYLMYLSLCICFCESVFVYLL